MPRVEQYQPDQVSTQIARGPRASAPPASGLQNVARGLSDLSTGFERLDKTAAEEATVEFEREKNDLFFNPESGYFNTQGRNAFDQAGSMSDALDELKRRHSEKLKSPGARQAFDRVANQHVTRARADIAQHSSKHLKAWEVATINSQVENTVENASLYWNDPERLEVQRALGRQSIFESAELEGSSPEVLRERLETYESSFAMSSITAATSSSSESGKAALDKWGAKLEGPDKLKIEAKIQSKEKAEKTQAMSREAVLKAGNLVDTYGDRDDARSAMIEDVNTIEDPDTRKAVMKESMFQLNAKLQADAEARGATFEAAENFIIDGGSVEVFKTQNPDQWERLNAKQKRALSSGKTVVTDFDSYYQLINQPVEKLASTNVSDHFHELDPTYRGKLQTAVNSARKGLRDGQTTRDAGRKQRLQELTGIKTPRTKTEITRYNSLNRVLDSMIVSKQEELGKDFLSDEQYEQVMSNFSKSIVKERDFWFDSSQNLTDIDSENLESYSNYLRANGIRVTTDTLLLVENNDEHKQAALKR